MKITKVKKLPFTMRGNHKNLCFETFQFSNHSLLFMIIDYRIELYIKKKKMMKPEAMNIIKMISKPIN